MFVIFCEAGLKRVYLPYFESDLVDDSVQRPRNATRDRRIGIKFRSGVGFLLVNGSTPSFGLTQPHFWRALEIDSAVKRSVIMY